jgi:hypothetical protein
MSAQVSAEPIELVEVYGDEDQVPSHAGAQITARMPELEDFERQSDDGDHAQPKDVGQPIGNRNKQVGDMTRQISEPE